jgi:hypothetical protein
MFGFLLGISDPLCSASPATLSVRKPLRPELTLARMRDEDPVLVIILSGTARTNPLSVRTLKDHHPCVAERHGLITGIWMSWHIETATLYELTPSGSSRWPRSVVGGDELEADGGDPPEPRSTGPGRP